ncbi:2,3-bisphosphoglycerate-dependent phosphoglycerate mutase 1 [Philodulcilactobacillus myokoensis]|uniref:2,3-bisphosphoglycerate-dependent phosphoglycerate mutase n=1 Tax=Philodulcilactobacillus myokoensis TaxID=2929573 RepID=A0A9W6B1K8_9LACO|nr:2,3-bisphosphoglycerate-dependent phosphoglycerate mutase [Philodulcilactobacillus myokoensis]GLB47187.1 2,3-bisphosphoglycerate-dependent phosphoglycerate mutase 1 [Philodulcilactobacillus myokoensis]
MSILTIMRHGESQANRDHVFTGWSDVPLTSKGVQQAHLAGQKLNRTGIQFSDVHTSFLVRSIDTANIVLDEINQSYIPEHKSWRLNERHYGALRGKNKQVVRKKVGDHQFKLWRRSFKTVPPLLKHHDHDPRYTKLGVIEPLGESLEMAYHRLMPYWVDSIAPRLLDHHNQLVVAHGSTLRALIKYLDQIPDDQIDNVEVPNGIPIEYEFDDHLNVINKKFIK